MSPISLKIRNSSIKEISKYAEEKDTPHATKSNNGVDPSIKDKNAATRAEIAKANIKEIPLDVVNIYCPSSNL